MIQSQNAGICPVCGMAVRLEGPASRIATHTARDDQHNVPIRPFGNEVLYTACLGSGRYLGDATQPSIGEDAKS